MKSLELVDYKTLSKPAKPELYCVIVCSAAGNSDFIPLTTLNDASKAFRAFCDENGFGAREAGDCQIWNHNKLVAHVAFNGNIFAGHYPFKKEDLLFNFTGLEWTGKSWDIAANFKSEF